MIKYFETVTNTRGDSLPNYRVQVVDSGGTIVEIYADSSGTRFTDSSGNIINYATADSRTGKVEFYWTPATGQVLQVLDLSGELVDATADFADRYVLANLPGNIAQSAVTNLTTDLAAKAATADLASTVSGKGAALVATTSGDTVQQALDYINDPVIYAAAYGVVGDDATDNTAAMIAAIAAAQAAEGTLVLPKGVIRCGDIGNLASSRFTMVGAGMGVTILKATHTSASGHATMPAGTAFFADAFQSGAPSDPFIEEFNLLDFTLEGNSATTNILWAQGIARSRWRIDAREAGGAAARAFNLRGCMSNTLELICSTNRYTMTSIPSYGLYVDLGSRAGSSIGQSSNNTFIRCLMEGTATGVRYAAADQNFFVGGASQACTTQGLSISNTCRYNTFIGTGFESTSATEDVADQGIQTLFENCYSAKKFLLQGQQPTVRGGYFERFEISSGCSNADISNIRINNWATGSGGWFDSSPVTGLAKWRSIYDMDLAAFVYPHRARTGITVGASPFTWTNTTGLPAMVHIISGTLTQVLRARGVDTVVASTAVPNAHFVAPGDALTVSYSSAPGMSYSPMAGF